VLCPWIPDILMDSKGYAFGGVWGGTPRGFINCILKI